MTKKFYYFVKLWSISNRIIDNCFCFGKASIKKSFIEWKCPQMEMGGGWLKAKLLFLKILRLRTF